MVGSIVKKFLINMIKKDLLEAIEELLDDKRIKTTVENCEHFDACYDMKAKTLKIQFYNDKRRLA